MALAAEDTFEKTVLLPQPPPIARDSSLEGRTLGHYKVKELLGRGSFGEVYRAVDPRLGRDVAVKVAESSIARDPELRRYLWNEARIQARLEHANIVPIYDLVEDVDLLFIVMRLIPGQDLDKTLQNRPFNPIEALHVMRQVSAALATAHDRGVIHQDLKPSNIRITPAGEAVVLDFGVARVSGQTIHGPKRPSGTPGYMSPEQIRGEPMDARSDIYSLAMTMYKTLTGHHPFEDASDLCELLAWQVERDPPSPRQFNGEITDALGDAILQGLAKRPRERFRGCIDFLQAVSNALGEKEIAAPKQNGGDGRWNPRAPVNFTGALTVPGQAPIDIQLVDLSITGAAMRVPSALPVDTRGSLALKIPLVGSEYVLRCDTRVLRTRAGDGDSAVVGVAFEDVGRYDQLVLSDLVRAVLVYRSSED